MNYSIDKSRKQPAYMQLYQYIRQDIIDGIYPYGTRLPSKRTISEETELSVIPVEHALEMLCDEGYVESKERSGMYVIYRDQDFAGRPGSVSDQVSFMKAQPEAHKDDAFPFSVMAKIMRKVLADYGEKLMVKSPNFGCDELRNAISLYLGRSRGLHISRQQIIIGSGAEYLYGLIVQLLGKERIYAIEDPSYEKIQKVYEVHGVGIRRLKMDVDGISSSELAFTDASVLHVTPFNSYPSGVSASASKKHEYLRWAEEREGYIIEDNYDSELTVSRKPEDTVFSMSPLENVIYVNTFSRTVAPSIRAGYMIVPEKLLEIYEERLGFYSCTVPVFEQYVLAELLDNGEYERHINRVRRKRRSRQ